MTYRTTPFKVLVFLSNNGQDPTEVVTPWEYLAANGVQVEFATENGTVANVDPRMISGIVGTMLGASSDVKTAYKTLQASPAWKSPHTWSSPDFDTSQYDGILLPGGHDKPMRQYLESPTLQKHMASYFPLTSRAGGGKKVVAAICHGVVVLTRSKGVDGKSVLWDCETTTLPEHMEKAAYFATAPFFGDYYRTYPEYTAAEVQGSLAKPSQFLSGGVLRSSPFTVVDKNNYYISARFPGDAKLFAEGFLQLLQEVRE